MAGTTVGYNDHDEGVLTLAVLRQTLSIVSLLL